MSFTLSAFADEIDMSLDVQMAELKKHDIRHIEMRGVNGKNIADLTLDEARAIKEQLDDNGFKISALGSPIGKILITDPFDPHYKKFVHLLELADILGTDYIRIFSFYMPKGQDPEQYYDEVIWRLKQLIGAAKKAGKILLHENEKEIYGDTAPRCEKLMKALYGPNFKATFDPANFVQSGQKVDEAYAILKKYIAYVHIKDALFSDGSVTPAGMGDGWIPSLLSELKASGFDGFLSLEPHLGDFVGFAALETGNAKLADSNMTPAKRFSVAVKALNDILEKI